MRGRAGERSSCTPDGHHKQTEHYPKMRQKTPSKEVQAQHQLLRELVGAEVASLRDDLLGQA